jgi:hypothetical protein
MRTIRKAFAASVIAMLVFSTGVAHAAGVEGELRYRKVTGIEEVIPRPVEGRCMMLSDRSEYVLNLTNRTARVYHHYSCEEHKEITLLGPGQEWTRRLFDSTAQSVWLEPQLAE